jgi:hypothetical protein
MTHALHGRVLDFPGLAAALAKYGHANRDGSELEIEAQMWACHPREQTPHTQDKEMNNAEFVD